MPVPALGELVANLRGLPAALVDEPMPDPFVLRLTDTCPGGARTSGLWMVATSSNRPYAFRLYRFHAPSGRWLPHLVEGQHQAIFPEGRLPSWWNDGELNSLEPDLPRDLLLARWAPELDVRHGRLTLHYTARDREGVLRSAYATADAIDGEWTDWGYLDFNLHARDLVPEYPGGLGGDNPVVGMIDGHVACVRDERGRQRTFLLTKVDGNSLHWTDAATGAIRRGPTPILSHEFIQDVEGRITLVGSPRVLTSNQPHHDGLIEGQFVIESDGQAYLVYSAGFFGNDAYRTYVAKVDLLNNEVGEERLLIDSASPALDRRWNGPGHPSFVKEGEGLFSMYLHVWQTGTDYLQHGERRKVVRLHVAMREEDGSAVAPYVLEERYAGRLKGLTPDVSAGAVAAAAR